jgi:hypothetical protein
MQARTFGTGPLSSRLRAIRGTIFFGLTSVKAQISLGRQDIYVFHGGSFENSTVIAWPDGI